MSRGLYNLTGSLPRGRRRLSSANVGGYRTQRILKGPIGFGLRRRDAVLGKKLGGTDLRNRDGGYVVAAGNTSRTGSCLLQPTP